MPVDLVPPSMSAENRRRVDALIAVNIRLQTEADERRAADLASRVCTGACSCSLSCKLDALVCHDEHACEGEQR